ncbi:hypothetical protein Gorai_005878, partial [Gossypium raimondii]|nr:hypothetical protein [Gossypium raimondii]
MEEELDNVSIIDEKEDLFQAQEDGSELEEGYKQCLVGSYLTASIVHFPLMRNIMSNLWHPVGGISIIDISDKRCLFRFFYEDISLRAPSRREAPVMSWWLRESILPSNNIMGPSNARAIELGSNAENNPNLIIYGKKGQHTVRGTSNVSNNVDSEPWRHPSRRSLVSVYLWHKNLEIPIYVILQRSTCLPFLQSIVYVVLLEFTKGFIIFRTESTTEAFPSNGFYKGHSLDYTMKAFLYRDCHKGVIYIQDLPKLALCKVCPSSFRSYKNPISANVETSICDQIGDVLGVRVATNLKKYLGLPMMVRRRKNEAFHHYVDRFGKKVQGWGRRFLSMDRNERIIWSSWSLIENGEGWRIGASENVNIWNDAWIPGQGNGRVQGHDFDVRAVRELFDEELVERVLCIPIGRSQVADEMIW